MSAQTSMNLVIIPSDWITNLRTTRRNQTEEKLKKSWRLE